MGDVKKFFNDHEKTLTGIVSVLSIIAFGATIWTLWLTMDQMELNIAQMKRTEDSTRANLIYQIDRDNQELMSRLLEEGKLYRFIFQSSNNQQLASEEIDKANAHIQNFVNFFAAIYQQKKYGLIDADVWGPYAVSFCGFLRLPPVAKWWSSTGADGAYYGTFLDFTNKLAKPDFDCLKAGEVRP
jgi:hypothetical protein